MLAAFHRLGAKFQRAVAIGLEPGHRPGKNLPEYPGERSGAWTREARRGAVFGTFFDFSREFLGSYSAKDLSATATPVIIVIVMPLPAGIHRKAFATHQSGIDTTF
jgi:hypothetical protein